MHLFHGLPLHPSGTDGYRANLVRLSLDHRPVAK
jgi:hypothetical protein